MIAKLRLLLLAAACLLGPMAPRAHAQFHPPGMWTWDNWFAYDGERWHAFYLQLPQAVGPDRRWKDNDFYKHVGHATSTDLRAWQDQGPAVCALSGTWNDRHIATGSVTRFDGRWWMAFTGRGTKGDGVGLAVSDDLMKWQPAQAGPLFPLSGTWATGSDNGVFSSEWKGTPRRWIGISDPYLTPEPIDGWYHMVLCARVLDVPLAESGCLTVLKSRDLRHWEQPAILAWPGCFERMETPQLWSRHDRWYLSFGGVLNTDWVKEHGEQLPAPVRGQLSHLNYYYVLPAANAVAAEADLHRIEISRSHYIMKVLPAGPDRDVAIFSVADKDNSSISKPYPVQYHADHSLELGETRPTSP
ncbi:MAG TPA: hypothetical protein VK961_05865 [Chthoniobacter sp.]|nr:hypothetical protein [Chthoniobacter sp.]